MIRIIALIMLFQLSFEHSDAQTYFPPVDGSDWETTDTEWCSESVDTLLSYLEARNSKSFIILIDGRIALEAYFNEHDSDLLWYWASAGKTITATLVGAALDDGLLTLSDPVNQYLGEGWTNCSVDDENERTIWHQLTMSSSFNNSPFLWDCTEPNCFQCTGAEAGSQWHYHNGVYRRLIEVVEDATGTGRNQLTNEKIEDVTGINGFWTDNLYWSTARDMARFGHLALNDFVWDETPVLNDVQFIQDLTTPSQDMNPAYGYLWWLNGQENYMLPLDQTVYSGWLIPSAPEDLFAGLGANDQKIYVVPSQNMVVIRQGNEAYGGTAALSGFDLELWELISNLDCNALHTDYSDIPEIHPFYPNPTSGNIYTVLSGIKNVAVFSLSGEELESHVFAGQSLNLSLKPGVYILKTRVESVNYVQKLIIQPK